MGENGIPVELKTIKRRGEVKVKWLRRSFDVCLKKGKVPEAGDYLSIIDN